MRYDCLMHNLAVQEVDGKSPFERRYGVPPSHIPLIPFGVMLRFRPIDPKLAGLPRFKEQGMLGLFVNYDVQPGGLITDDYYVTPLHHFKDGAEKAPSIYRIKEIFFDEASGLRFPLREAQDDFEAKVTHQPSFTKIIDAIPDEPVEEEKVQPEVGELPLDAFDAAPEEEKKEFTTAEEYDQAQKELDEVLKEEAGDVRAPREYKGSTRVPYVWPEVWQALDL